MSGNPQRNSSSMWKTRPKLVCPLLFVLALCSPFATAQQDTFHWIDFHSDKDQPIVVWVTRALTAEKWTSIREIGVLYDAALVVTTDRPNPSASPREDSFQIWSVSLTTHAHSPLIKGVNLRWLDWLQFTDAGPRELGLLYDDCRDCEPTTYFTAFHYDFSQHIFTPRWLRGNQTVPVWTDVAPAGVTLSQVYAVLSDPNGRQWLGTWNHFDYGKEKPAEDYVYRYDRDFVSGLERTQLLSGKDALAAEQKLCAAQGESSGLARGQSSALCQQNVHPRAERKPVTTPPANNEGRSVPPGSRVNAHH